MVTCTITPCRAAVRLNSGVRRHEADMPLSETQKQYADQAEANGYLPVYRSIVQDMCACFWWHGEDDQGKYRIFQNGTVCFVDTGRRLIAVTAAHVLKEYMTAKERDPSIVCQLGNITYNPEDHVIAIDHALDLATFAVSEVVVAGSGSSPSKPLAWPPSTVMRGDVLLCAGHPGALRKENSTTADLPFQWLLAAAASSNENITLTLELDDCHVPLAGAALQNHELGGMSGGPVFKYIPPCPLERIELVGFIYEFQPSYGLLFARPANFIDQSGKVIAGAA